MGFASRWNEFNPLTQDWHCVLSELGQFRDNDKFIRGKPWIPYLQRSKI